MKLSAQKFFSCVILGCSLILVYAQGAVTPKLGDYRTASKTSVPRNTYDPYSAEEAQKESAKKKRPLVILVESYNKKEREIGQADAVKAFWGLQDECLMLVTNSSNWNPLPEKIRATIQSTGHGKEAPRVFVLADDGTTWLAGISFEKLKALTPKDLTALGQELRKLNTTKTPSATYPPPTAAETKQLVK